MTIAAIHQSDAAGQAAFARPFDLLPRHFRLGGEFDIVGNACFLAPRRIAGPFFQKIQLVGDGQTGMMIGERKRNRDLAIRLLADLAAILMRHAHGLRTVFGKTRIIDDSYLDRPMPLDPRQRGSSALPRERRHPTTRFCS